MTTHLHAAARSYALVAATDPGYASASFGLARVSMELGDREAAAAALQRVPKSSSAYVTAQVASCRVLCAPLPGDPPTVADLAASSGTLAGLSLENSVRLPLLRDLHLQALAMLLEERVAADDDIVLDGAALNEEGQRTRARAHLPVAGQAGPERGGAVRAGRPGECVQAEDTHMRGADH